MTRLAQLPENNIKSQILSLRHDIDALKTAQAIGSTSVRPQRIISPNYNTGDLIINTAYNVINGWNLDFTPASNGIANTGYLWHQFLVGFALVGSGTYAEYIDGFPFDGTKFRTQFWIMGTSSSATASFKISLVIYAMTYGTISVSQIQ